MNDSIKDIPCTIRIEQEDNGFSAYCESFEKITSVIAYGQTPLAAAEKAYKALAALIEKGDSVGASSMTTTDSTALSTTIAKLQELLTWPENWNTYNASAPRPESVARATAWITEVYQLLQQSWIEPHVGADGDGEVEFDWRYKQRKLSIYFDEQNIYYLQVDGQGVKAPIYDGDITSINDMQQLWQWLLDTTEEVQV